MNNKRFITNQKEIWKLEKVTHNSLSFKDIASNNGIVINLKNYNPLDYRINIVVEREFKKYKNPITFETSYDQNSKQYYMDIDNIIKNLYSILGITYNSNVTLAYSPEYINVGYLILSIFSLLGMGYFIYSYPNIFLSTLFFGFCLFGLFKGITELVEKINIKKRTDPEEYIILLHLEIIKFQDEPTKTTLTLAKDNVIYKEESSLSVAREYEDYYNNNSNIDNYISIPVYKRKNKDKKFYYNQDIEDALINFKDKEK